MSSRIKFMKSFAVLVTQFEDEAVLDNIAFILVLRHK